MPILCLSPTSVTSSLPKFSLEALSHTLINPQCCLISLTCTRWCTFLLKLADEGRNSLLVVVNASAIFLSLFMSDSDPPTRRDSARVFEMAHVDAHLFAQSAKQAPVWPLHLQKGDYFHPNQYPAQPRAENHKSDPKEGSDHPFSHKWGG